LLLFHLTSHTAQRVPHGCGAGNCAGRNVFKGARVNLEDAEWGDTVF
jgi:hypothetical protein